MSPVLTVHHQGSCTAAPTLHVELPLVVEGGLFIDGEDLSARLARIETVQAGGTLKRVVAFCRTDDGPPQEGPGAASGKRPPFRRPLRARTWRPVAASCAAADGAAAPPDLTAIGWIH